MLIFAVLNDGISFIIKLMEIVNESLKIWRESNLHQVGEDSEMPTDFGLVSRG